MAIEKTYLLGKNITLGCGFDLQAKAPLDSRQVVPEYDGLQALIDGNAAYEGMIVYDEGTKKTYQAQLVDGVLAFREFGINEAELKDLIASETTAAMEFKGAATALPENPSKGDFYKVTASFDVSEGETAQVGDSIVYDGEQWFLIPSGDDIEDTWRPVTDVDNDATLTFAAGDKLDVAVASNGTVTYSHEEIAAPTVKKVGDDEGDEPTRTYIASIETDGFGHITGYKTATETVENTNTTYAFEGQSDEATSVYFQVTSSDAEAAEVIYLDAYSKNESDAALSGAIEAVKAESANQAAVILSEAQAYTNSKDEEVRGLIGDNAKAIDDLEAYVGAIPNVPDEDGNNKYADLDVIGYINKKAQETLAAASGNSTETAASVKGQLDDYIGQNNNRVKAIEDDVAAIKDAENGILKQAQDYADGLAGNYDEAGAAAGVKSELEAEIAKKVDKETYEADKATFAITETVNAALDLKANAADVVANDTFESFKSANTQAIADAKAGAISEVEGKGYAVATEVADTYATKTELGNVDKKFESYNTTAVQKGIDDAQDARIKAIEDDYLVEADIANFETKDNVKKVADDLAAYVKSNDEALAAEVKARDDADKAFETRIAALEGNFGDGEGTVEAQIATAVKAEEDARKEAVQGVQDAVDAVAGRMDTAEGKISALETESAKHAIKTEVEAAIDLKADKSVVEAMYTNTQIDTAVQGAKDYAKGLVDAIPAQIDYSVTCADSDFEATTDAPAFKRHTLTQNGATICTIDIPKELVVEAGSVKAVTEEGKPYAEAKVGDKYIELVIANQEEPIYVPAKDLVDIYTAKDGATEVQIAISNINEISATLVNGGITEEKLDENIKTKLNKTWEEVGVAKGLVDALADGQVKTNKEAIDAINNAETGILKQAKDYADGLAGNYAEAEHEHVVADITDFESVVEARITAKGYATAVELAAEAEAREAKDTELATAIETAKTEAANQDAVILAEAQSYADQAKADAIADAEGKVNALAGNVYTKEQTYTQEEVNALLTWGEF